MIFGSPPIVTNGLILNLDAANTKSYIRTGSVWRDISGNNRTGSFVNGPIFSTDAGGSVLFDGTNDTVNLGVGTNWFPIPQITIDIWFKSLGKVATTGTTPGLFGFTYGLRASLDSNTGNISFGVNNSAGTSMTFVSTTGYSYFDSLWHNIVCQNDGTTSYVYIDGTLKGSGAATWTGTTFWPSNNFNIGRDNNNDTQFFYGNVSTVKIYNRVLTPQEIQQNYNSLKSRFNL